MSHKADFYDQSVDVSEGIVKLRVINNNHPEDPFYIWVPTKVGVYPVDDKLQCVCLEPVSKTALQTRLLTETTCYNNTTPNECVVNAGDLRFYQPNDIWSETISGPVLECKPGPRVLVKLTIQVPVPAPWNLLPDEHMYGRPLLPNRHDTSSNLLIINTKPTLPWTPRTNERLLAHSAKGICGEYFISAKNHVKCFRVDPNGEYCLTKLALEDSTKSILKSFTSETYDRCEINGTTYEYAVIRLANLT